MNNTIVALATPPMNGAIHIIRISGSSTYSIINKITSSKITKIGYSIQRTFIVENKQKIDDVLIMKFVSPKSFTGEDLVEINCHGGYFLANKIINLLVENGCTLAKKGEFSKRSFMNKKISLIQAHSINTLINAKNDKALSIGNIGLHTNTTKKINEFIEKMFDILGIVEVNIDYPEYNDVKQLDQKKLIASLTSMVKEMEKIIKDSSIAMKYVNGFNIAIIGKPNVGKSSLLNAFIKEDKAIVSNIKGTTRDAIESSINIKGLTFNFIDTAGIHNKTNNKIEKYGINKSKDVLNKADLILFVIDGSRKIDNDDKQILNLIKDKDYIIVNNKSDLKQVNNNLNSISISAKKNDINKLINTIVKKVATIKYDSESIILQTYDTIATLKSIKNTISNCIIDLKQDKPIDLTMEYLHEAYLQLLDIVGKNEDYSFIDEMFEKFCLGK
jgi:tRNA modification GTPase